MAGCNERKKGLPIGVESFGKLRANGCYYADKTGLITDITNSNAEVTLITRPRRFGKSLNMSMLEAFFSPDSDKRVFDGLRIAGETGFCERYMGRHPVISLSLKSLEGGSYGVVYQQMSDLVSRAAARIYRQVRDTDRIFPWEMERLMVLLQRNIPESDLFGSLYTMSEILEQYYGSKVIILIDEYDVPLARAYEDGYYDQMVTMIRNFLHLALKTNNSLEFAVLTGCMRIAKESIFTGLNNLRVLGIADERAAEYFGFTDREVRDLLGYYGISDKYDEVRDWYDGYRFGNTSVYCPWDVINYCDMAISNTDAFPENYWINSSGNSVVRRLVESSGSASVKGDIEALINGEAIEKPIRQELTYEEMYSSVENLWSVLFTTGYLTFTERSGIRLFKLAIPNREVWEIFTEQILELFSKDVASDTETHARICDAFLEKDIAAIEECLGTYLRRTISIRDCAVRSTMKENFYHGLMLSILGFKADWWVASNQEAGDGYSDIIVRCNDYETAMVIELKYTDSKDNMEEVCSRALRQIEERNYSERLSNEGYGHIVKYGIAFHLKSCAARVSE